MSRRSLTRMSAALLAFALGACEKSAPEAPKYTGPVQLTVPADGKYTGAYIEFGDTEDDVSIEKIEGFEKLVGKKQAIVASSSYWGQQTFPAANLELIHLHGSVPLIFWSPWDKPYHEQPDPYDPTEGIPTGPDQFSLTNILAGKCDAYIDRWAAGAKQFGQPFFVSFCNEMNGTWFPWSGFWYGGGTPIPGTNPVQYQGPETFKKAYRYVVDRCRKDGATNILWVFHAMNTSYPYEAWNDFTQYYPGSKYIDWIGFSVYGQQFIEDNWTPFKPLLSWSYTVKGKKYEGPYERLCEMDPTKPVMLCEWGCGEFPVQEYPPRWINNSIFFWELAAQLPITLGVNEIANPLSGGNKAAFLTEAYQVMKTMPNVKAAIYWNERWQDETGYYSNLHVNSSPEALEAYRQGVADPIWLDHPVYEPKK